MELPDIKEIAPSESGYPVKDYSINLSDYDADGNRIATDNHTPGFGREVPPEGENKI